MAKPFQMPTSFWTSVRIAIPPTNIIVQCCQLGNPKFSDQLADRPAQGRSSVDSIDSYIVKFNIKTSTQCHLSTSY